MAMEIAKAAVNRFLPGSCHTGSHTPIAAFLPKHESWAVATKAPQSAQPGTFIVWAFKEVCQPLF